MVTDVKMPDFLYIGAPKCASTWIFQTLKAHPQIYVPPAKDIFFFDRQYHRGIEWYQSFFASVGAEHCCSGELSTSYLYSESAAGRIRETLPCAKLMACVRNPIARAWSAYLFKKRNGMTAFDFQATLADDPKIMEWGLYSKYLAHYRELFGEERFRVFVYDDLQQNPVQFRQSLYFFLGVNPAFENPITQRKVLPASRPRSAAVAALAKRGARLARSLGLANLVGRLKSSSVLSSALYVPLEERLQERMSQEQWDRLATYYAEDIARVSALLGRDMGHWLKRPAADEVGSATR